MDPSLENLDEVQFQLLRLIDISPEITQRELAHQTGVSLGKVNYLLKALVEKGFIKARNFRNSRSKWSYLYALTPSGIEHRARMTYEFLKRKNREFNALRAEIAELEAEAQQFQVEPEELAKSHQILVLSKARN
ncbi:MAG: MarR family EPS-associated transcriptional regulator [Leptospiraceae bacterium]|nr:MarR family EPS-associated transcriptional regulator [Leptospiraceae bacterium]